MKEKLFDPARHNEKAPAPGMAAVNTHSQDDDEEPIENISNNPDRESKEEEPEEDQTGTS